MSPWQAVQEAAQPIFDTSRYGATSGPIQFCCFWSLRLRMSAALNLVAMCGLRVWNPSREVAPRLDEERERELAEAADVGPVRTSAVAIHGAGGKVRNVWDNPVLWREVRTWAYGKRILVIRLAYWAVFIACAVVLVAQARGKDVARRGNSCRRQADCYAAGRRPDPAQRAGRHVADERAR